MADQENPREAASKTAGPTAEQPGTAAAIEDQSRMCCAVGDLSCVVPVVVTRKDPPGQPETGDAPQATVVSRGDQ